MKKIACLILTATLLWGCYKDKGNYDYNDGKLNKVAVSFVPEALEKREGALSIDFPKPLGATDEQKRIEVKVDQTLVGNLENLAFTWVVTDKINKNAKDTVHTHGYIDLTLYGGGKNTDYDILLKITDQTTTLESFYSLNVKTRLLYLNSWFVLHGRATNAMQLGNVEHIQGSEPVIVQDAYKKLGNVENIFTNATHLFYGLSQHINNYRSPELLGVASADGIKPYYPFGIKEKTNILSLMFPASSTNFVFKEIHSQKSSDSFVLFVSMDGRVLVGRGNYMLYEPEGETGLGTYAIEKACYHPEVGYGVLWDKLGKRFLYNYFTGNDFSGAAYSYNRANAKISEKTKAIEVDYTVLPAPERPADKTPLFFFPFGKEDGLETGVRTVFMDASKNAYVYTLTQNQNAASDKITFDIKGGKAASIGKLDANTQFAYSDAFENVFFYASGGRIYRYNCIDGAADVVFDVEDHKDLQGFKITDIEFRIVDQGPFNSFDFNFYLGIALSTESQGIVKEVKLTRGGDVDTTYPDRTYPGFEPIKQIVFGTQYLNI